MAKTIIGTVTSKAGAKSIIVMIKTSKRHPLYRKSQTRTSKFMAHDTDEKASIDDVVVISEVAPISARKRFVLTKVVFKGGIHYEADDATSDVADEVLGVEKTQEEEE